MIRWAIAAALIAAMASSATALEGDEETSAIEFDFEWRSDGDDDTTRYAAKMKLGDRLALRAAKMFSSSAPRFRWEIARRAVKAYEEAARVAPEQAEPHYRAAAVINGHFINCRGCPSTLDVSSARYALEHWAEFERLAPLDPRVKSVLSPRSLIYTKLATKADYARALADYKRLIEIDDVSALAPTEAARRLSNMAEIHMMIGQLEPSIAMYARSLQFGSNSLYGLGLAVALDRDGQGLKAREIMQRYGGHGGMRKFVQGLVGGNTFFVPKGEVNYYFALGLEISGHYGLAIERYQAFIDSGAHAQYHDRAREVIAGLATKGKSKAKPPIWWAEWEKWQSR